MIVYFPFMMKGYLPSPPMCKTMLSSSRSVLLCDWLPFRSIRLMRLIPALLVKLPFPLTLPLLGRWHILAKCSIEEQFRNLSFFALHIVSCFWLNSSPHLVHGFFLSATARTGSLLSSFVAFPYALCWLTPSSYATAHRNAS